MSSSGNSVESAAFHSQTSKPLPIPLLAFQPEVGMLGIQARPGDSLIVSSSVHVGTSVAHCQMLLEKDSALSCRKPLEILVETPADGPAPYDAKDLGLSNMKFDGPVDDDHASPLRMRAVLRTLFQIAQLDVCSEKNPKIEKEGTVNVEIDYSGDSGCKDIAPRMEGDISSAVTDILDEKAMDEKNGNEENPKKDFTMLKDGKGCQEESGSVELDHDRSSYHTVKESVADTETKTEELVVETSMDLMNLALAHTDVQEKTSEYLTSPTHTTVTDSHTKRSMVSALFEFTGLNHVAFCCENLEKTLEFYCGLLGLKASPDRPDLPYRGAWLFLGTEGIHIMEVPNPDPVYGRPQHGGWDRHACVNCSNVESLRKTLDNAGIPYQLSMVPSIFCRDPDGNGLEFIEITPRG